MTDQPTPPDRPQARAPHSADPLPKRAATCTIWLAAYALVWALGVWRPLPQVAWVNLAILAAIPIATLPPARARPFTACAALLALGAVMWLVIHNQLMAIVLGVTGLLALSDGLFNPRAGGPTHPSSR
jgi:hypothetical protein